MSGRSLVMIGGHAARCLGLEIAQSLSLVIIWSAILHPPPIQDIFPLDRIMHP